MLAKLYWQHCACNRKRYQNNLSMYFKTVNKLQHSAQMTYIFKKEHTITVCYLGKLVFHRMKKANFRRLQQIQFCFPLRPQRIEAIFFCWNPCDKKFTFNTEDNALKGMCLKCFSKAQMLRTGSPLQQCSEMWLLADDWTVSPLSSSMYHSID